MGSDSQAGAAPPRSWLQPGSSLSPVIPSPGSPSCRLSKLLTLSQSPLFRGPSSDLHSYVVTQADLFPARSEPHCPEWVPFPRSLVPIPSPSQSISASLLPGPYSTHPTFVPCFLPLFQGLALEVSADCPKPCLWVS